jgi:hypothetical protein
VEPERRVFTRSKSHMRENAPCRAARVRRRRAAGLHVRGALSQLQEAAGMGVHAVELRSAARAQWVFQGRKHDSGGSRAGPGRDEKAAARSVLDKMSSL